METNTQQKEDALILGALARGRVTAAQIETATGLRFMLVCTILDRLKATKTIRNLYVPYGATARYCLAGK